MTENKYKPYRCLEEGGKTKLEVIDITEEK